MTSNAVSTAPQSSARFPPGRPVAAQATGLPFSRTERGSEARHPTIRLPFRRAFCIRWDSSAAWIEAGAWAPSRDRSVDPRHRQNHQRRAAGHLPFTACGRQGLWPSNSPSRHSRTGLRAKPRHANRRPPRDGFDCIRHWRTPSHKGPSAGQPNRPASPRCRAW